MIFTGNDDDLLISDFIDETVFICQAARPVAFEFVFERFGMAYALERSLCRLGNNTSDALEQFLSVFAHSL